MFVIYICIENEAQSDYNFIVRLSVAATEKVICFVNHMQGTEANRVYMYE